MKKDFTTALVATLMLFTFSGFAQTGSVFKQWGEETLTKIEQDFRIPNSNLYYETTDHNAIAFHWPTGVQLHALIAAGKISQAEAFSNEIHAKYWCFTNNRWGYNAVANGCGDRYYDDNAWVAKANMELYLATNNATYLNRAKDIIAFSMSGENPAPDGGVRFHEGDANGMCLCATAPTIVTNLMIYRATNISSYLTDGLRIYNWAKANRWGFGPGYRGYENAVLTQAAILLFRITNDQVYYQDAVTIGLKMESAYIDWNTHALRETGQWGGHDMTNAYVELYQLDGDVYWLNLVSGYLNYLHANLKDANGRYPETWNSPAGTAGNPALLYQASAARAYAKMGTTPGGYPKFPDPVSIYKDCNFDGWWQAGFMIGKYTLTDLTNHGAFGKDASSIRVQSGYKVTFYENADFTGASVVLTADNSCLVNNGWNDRMNSMIVEVASPTTTVYKDCGYTGRAVHLPVGNYTLAQLQARGINDNDISSLTITAGYEVVLYELDNFGGTSVTLNADTWCLVQTGSNWNDKASSIKVRIPCTVTPIVPYLSINGATAVQTNTTNVLEGNSLKLSPQPTTGGSWAWTGPNNFTSTNREVIFNSISVSQAGTYNVVYTNAGGCTSTASFIINVNPNLVATVYKDCNYGGYAVSLSPGDYKLSDLTAKGVLDNDISSLKVTSGYEVQLYADDNFSGTTLIVRADNGCLVQSTPNWNDITTSLRIRAVTGNQAPSVSITSPVNNAAYNNPATITINATATDVDGTIAKVEFYNGSTLLGTSTTSPYTYTWSGVTIGAYNLTAKATDNSGAVTTSAIVAVKVNAVVVNQPPSVSITSPANNTSFNAPASITINATAADSDGTISKVEFYNGATLLGTDNTSPYSYTWTNVATGTYTLSAKAYDNSTASTTSGTVTVVVKTVSTDVCASLNTYVANGGYVAGSKVKNNGRQYECREWPNSGWCNGAAWAYAPGTGTYWTDAWYDRGSCTARISQASMNNDVESVYISPNPASDVITIQADQSVLVSVYNSQGVLVINAVQVEAKGTLDISNLPAGMYLVKMDTGADVYSRTLLKK